MVMLSGGSRPPGVRAMFTLGTVQTVTAAKTFEGAVTFSAAGAAVTLSSATGAIAIGTTPATTGAVRLANAADISARAVANNADIVLMRLTTLNRITISPGGYDVQIMDAGGASLGFHGVTPVLRQVSAANLTNSVTAGGTDDTIADFTDLTTYSVSAAAIRNDIYQLARKLKQVNDGLRAYGLFT